MKATELDNNKQYLEYLLTIKQFFNRHRHGSYLFAVASSFHLRQEVNREVKLFCNGEKLNVGETSLQTEIEQSLHDQLQEAKAKYPGGLILTNIDELLLRSDNEFAYGINFMREQLLNLQIPILIWLSPFSHQMITQKAIDLYTRRALDTLFFPDIKAEQTAHLLERSEMKLEMGDDAEEIRTRIYLLEKQLVASRTDNIPRKRVAKEIVYPLIVAYRDRLMLNEALALKDEFAEDFDESDTNLLRDFGNLYIKSTDLDKAINYFEKALIIDKDSSGEESKKVANDYVWMGYALRQKGEYDLGITFYEKALAIDIKIHSEEYPKRATLYNNLGTAYDNKGDYDRAITYYEKAIAIDKKFHGEKHPDIAIRYSNLGIAYDNKGDYDRAINYFEIALKISKEFYKEEHPSVATIYSNLGNSYGDKGNNDRAISYYEKALAIDKKLYGDEHLNIATRYNNLGSAYHKKGDYDRAIDYYGRALKMLSKFLPPTHPYLGITQNSLSLAISAKNGETK